MRGTPALAGGLVLLSLLSGCTRWHLSMAARSLEERIQRARKVEVPGLETEKIPQITVLFVEETHLVLDASLIYRAADPELLYPWMKETGLTPGPVHLPMGPWSGDPSPEWLIPALRDALMEVRVQQTRIFSDLLEEPAVLFVVSPELDWIALARVLYSAGTAGMGPWRFAVQNGGDVGFLKADVPGFCGSSSSLEAVVGLGALSEPCAEPVILLRPQGAEVRILEGRSGAAGACGTVMLGSRNPGENPSSSWPRYLPGPDGSELTLPRAASSGLDLVLFAKALRQVAEIAPSCTHGLLGAERGVSWGELAPVLASMRRDAGMETVHFYVSQRE